MPHAVAQSTPSGPRSKPAFGRALLFAGTVAGVLFSAGASNAVMATQDRSLANGVYTEVQAARGETAYARFCAACHGIDREGTEYGPGLRGDELAARWNDRTLAELYRLTRSTMPVNSPGGLDAGQYVDIVAFLLREAGYPAGTQGLPVDLPRLAEITFVALGSGR